MNRKLLAAFLLAALGLTGAALADHATVTDGRPGGTLTASTTGYAGRGARGQYDYARVLSSEPIVRYVTVSRPVRECHREVEYYSIDRRARGSGASTLMGAIIGGVIGHQFGSGRGNDAATVAGTLIGAAAGSSSAAQRYGYETVEHSRPVRRCSTRIEEGEERRIDGYRVIYAYNGRKYATEMPYDPGRELRVRVDIRPAG